MKKEVLSEAFRDTVPVMTGYLVLGAGFGIIMDSHGYGFLLTVAMSLFIYAGSMQYAAVGLLGGAPSLLTVALTTLAVNARHLFYGISMVGKYKPAGARKPYLIFSLTDETYSLVCGGEKSIDYCFAVSLLDHFYWVAGTAAGALIGKALDFDTAGIDFALTALFITVFTDQQLRGGDRFSAAAGVGITVLCLVLFGEDVFLIPSMGLILSVLLLRMKLTGGKNVRGSEETETKTEEGDGDDR